MMDERDLYALLVILIERAGAIEISKKDIENLSLDGKVLAIVPHESKFVISVEREEDVDAEFESKEAG